MGVIAYHHTATLKNKKNSVYWLMEAVRVHKTDQSAWQWQNSSRSIYTHLPTYKLTLLRFLQKWSLENATDRRSLVSWGLVRQRECGESTHHSKRTGSRPTSKGVHSQTYTFIFPADLPPVPLHNWRWGSHTAVIHIQHGVQH
ncbi:hypothetical protein Ddc_04087 [Ditylenchus destructor]|nr:hypothetical protein Ddc_04087 [Ditylenchus destructor]